MMVRSSSLPALMVCGNSVLNTDDLQAVEQEVPSADLGTLIHRLCQSIVETGSYDLPAYRTSLPEADYARAAALINNFIDIWKVAADTMTQPVTERYLETDAGGFVLTGHIDCYHTTPEVSYVLDYKTGRQHEDHYHQMAGYAYLLWSDLGKPLNHTLYVTAIYLEDKTVQSYSFTADVLVAWIAQVGEKVGRPGYTPGRKCGTCPFLDSCPAFAVYGRAAVQAIKTAGEFTPADWKSMSPADRGTLLDQMYALDKGMGRAKAALKILVQKEDEVDIGGNKVYTVVRSEERTVNVAKALPVLKRAVGMDAILENARMPLDTILGVYAKSASKGQKARAKEELFEQLDRAGAIVRVETSKMWRRPKGEVQLEDREQ